MTAGLFFALAAFFAAAALLLGVVCLFCWLLDRRRLDRGKAG